MPGERQQRLILAYLVVGLAALALYGAVTGNRKALEIGAGFAYIAAVVHSISFRIRVRRRRSPAILLGAARPILVVTLVTMAAAAVGNLVAVAVELHDRHSAWHSEGTAAAGWAIVVVALAWRVWILPSARRAAVLQLVAMLFAVPAFVVPTAKLDAPTSDIGVMLDTAWIIAFIVIATAGPVLDRLFSSLDDKDPEVIPEAILRHD